MVAELVSARGEVPRGSLVVTVLVNWNGARDTMECLDSLLAQHHREHCVVVVDNGSKDDSVAQLDHWARQRFGSSQADETGASGFLKIPANAALDASSWRPGTSVYLVEAGRNLGFAGGVNVGLRFMLANPDAAFAWVLNNDTTADPRCLSSMLERLRADPQLGMCGSRILYYHARDTVQVLGGGALRRLTGGTYLLGAEIAATSVVDPASVERALDHLSGASMLVSRRFLENVGMMDEGYFLYYEECDWAERGRGRFTYGYADDAVVFHKEGASIGSSSKRARRSELSDYFLVRSRLRFTRKFYPWALPTVLAYSFAAAAKALVRGQPRHASVMLAAIAGISPERALGWSPGP